jgi:hypothetical protein
VGKWVVWGEVRGEDVSYMHECVCPCMHVGGGPGGMGAVMLDGVSCLMGVAFLVYFLTLNA